MTSIARKARIAGLLYLLLILGGLFSLIYVPGRILVHGNPAATAANIATHEALVRIGVATEILSITLELAVALALYRLLARVDKGSAQLMVILGGILPIPIYFLNAMNWIGALQFAGGGIYAKAFTPLQRDAMVTFFITLHHYGFIASYVFAGLWLLPMGSLVYRSGFLPRFIGVWLIANGFTDLAVSLCGLIVPQYEDMLMTVTTPLALGEIVLMLWLVIMGAKRVETSNGNQARGYATVKQRPG